jgi:site-specific DNA recombinase
MDIVHAKVRKLADRRGELQRERAAWLREQQRTNQLPTNMPALWPDLDTERRRAVISTVIEAVIAGPAGGRNRFNPDRVSIVWR